MCFVTGLTDADLAESLGLNPSLHVSEDIKTDSQITQSQPIDLKVTGNIPKVETEEKMEIEPSEPLSDLDFISSQTKQ